MVNEIPSWFVKNEMITTTDGFIITLWTAAKEVLDTDYYQTINNSPLQLVSVWVLHRDLIADINDHIVRKVINQNFIDLDW